jgi:thiol:disulfide interchange protein DsbD
MKKLTTTLLALLLSFAVIAQEEELLEPEKAFALTVTTLDTDTVQARWDIAEGYYLYRSKFTFSSNTAGITLGEPSYPAGKIKHDEFFGDVETYRGSITITIPVERAAGAPDTFTITANSQGCADIGVCYPPQRQSREITLTLRAGQ